MNCDRFSRARPTALSVLLLTLGLSGCAFPRVDGPSSEPRLRGRTVEEWCQLLEPTPGMSAWQQVAWETTYHAGADAAAKAEKPLLLWLMNGHPLGCT